MSAFDLHLRATMVRVVRHVENYLDSKGEHRNFVPGQEFSANISADGKTAWVDLGAGCRTKLFRFANDYCDFEELDTLDLIARALLPENDPRRFDPNHKNLCPWN